VVNHLGVNPDLFLSRYDKRQTALRENDMKKLSIEGKKVVLFVGRLQKKKGVHQLLKTVRLLEKQMNDFVLLIVGSHSYGKHISTPYIRYLRRLAKPFIESKRIRHVSFVSTDQIHRYYRLADVVVVPSTGPEAFGLVNLEAMSTEVPVIASNVGGIPEIIHHHDNGILISLSNHVPEMAEALCQILTDQEWARRLGKKGREDITNYFSWEQVANRLYQYYLS
jgi:spore coat protein SA